MWKMENGNGFSIALFERSRQPFCQRWEKYCTSSGLLCPIVTRSEKSVSSWKSLAEGKFEQSRAKLWEFAQLERVECGGRRRNLKQAVEVRRESEVPLV